MFRSWIEYINFKNFENFFNKSLQYKVKNCEKKFFVENFLIIFDALGNFKKSEINQININLNFFFNLKKIFIFIFIFLLFII